MRSLSLYFLLAAGITAMANAAAAPEVLFQDNFESGISERWIERGFPSIERKNRFSLATDADGNHYLEVVSDRSTSGRGLWLTFDADRCGEIEWRWKISRVIATADLTRKQGDDSAAKLYVILDGPSWWNPLDKRLLIYVWDNRLPLGSVLANTWEPKKARMIVLESGSENANLWIHERIDLASDFRRAFPAEEPGEVEALAFSADTDNTGEKVIAGFDDLIIRCQSS